MADNHLEDRTYEVNPAAAQIARQADEYSADGTRGLMVRDALTRRLIPYAAITLVAPRSRRRLRIQHGLASEIILAPADPKTFLADLAARAPHLTRRGQELVLRDRYVEYHCRNLGYIPG